MGKIINNSYQREIVTINGGIAKAFLFKSFKPNVVFIRNMGSAELFVGMDMIPSTSNYDDKIPSSSKQSVARPVTMDSIGLYSTQNATLIIESYAVEDMKPADIPETQPVLISNVNPVNMGDINSIINPLPSGTNSIGKVELSGSIPSGVNNIGKVDINSLPSVTVSSVSDRDNTPKKITLSAGTPVVVKSSKGKVLAISTSLTDLIVQDSGDEVWKGNYQSNEGFTCFTNIQLVSATGGVAYIVYR